MLREARQFNFNYLFYSFGLIFLLACETKEEQMKPEMFEEVILSNKKADALQNITLDEKPKTSIIEKKDFDFKPYIRSNKIGEEIVTGNEKESRYFTKYLGELVVGDSVFHVITQFIEIQCAIEKRGRCRIVFINKETETIKVYTEMMQVDLPVRIKKNLLVYNYEGKELSQSMEDKLKPLFCLPENRGCF